MSLGKNSVLGISMGTSMAAGYVDAHGHITTWLNEHAFAPVDYRADGPLDEWSKDRGCGVQFFSQQGVARLAKLAGIDLPETMPLAERLVEVQKLMKEGDVRARNIYETIGTCFGYALAHYAQFCHLENVLVLGRVTSGEGGEIILEKAREVLATEFPELSQVSLSMPDEQMKRHGQAVAAASLASF
jgi:predicted NBD/HSP70 family sugar kinase